jgi:hypothetical protein
MCWYVSTGRRLDARSSQPLRCLPVSKSGVGFPEVQCWRSATGRMQPSGIDAHLQWAEELSSDGRGAFRHEELEQLVVLLSRLPRLTQRGQKHTNKPNAVSPNFTTTGTTR